MFKLGICQEERKIHDLLANDKTKVFDKNICYLCTKQRVAGVSRQILKENKTEEEEPQDIRDVCNKAEVENISMEETIRHIKNVSRITSNDPSYS